MIFIILKYTLYSLLIIVIFHYIYDFLKNTLTIPKTIDLVNKPSNMYDDIYKTLNNYNFNNSNSNNINNYSSNTSGNYSNTNYDIDSKKINNNINDINQMNSINNFNINDKNVYENNNDPLTTNMKIELKNFFENLKSNEYNSENSNLNYSDYSFL